MGYQQLVTEERHQIAAMRSLYLSVQEIARRRGRHRSTLYRELKRNASAHDGNYRASHSVQKTSGRKSRSRRNGRFGADDFVWIERLIRLNLSPEQIVGRMRLEGRKVMSHETIYRWILKDRAAGGALWLYLRGARKQRRKRYGRYDSRGRLAGKKMIGSRPASVETRKHIGHWTAHKAGMAVGFIQTGSHALPANACSKKITSRHWRSIAARRSASCTFRPVTKHSTLSATIL